MSSSSHSRTPSNCCSQRPRTHRVGGAPASSLRSSQLHSGRGLDSQPRGRCKGAGTQLLTLRTSTHPRTQPHLQITAGLTLTTSPASGWERGCGPSLFSPPPGQTLVGSDLVALTRLALQKADSRNGDQVQEPALATGRFISRKKVDPSG